MKNSSFDFQGNILQTPFATLFLKFALFLILLFAFAILVDLFQNIFGKKEETASKNYLPLLFVVLNKVFLFGGIGFIAANFLQKIFENIGTVTTMNSSGTWENLAFGVILLFIGFGFKKIRILVSDRQVSSGEHKDKAS